MGGLTSTSTTHSKAKAGDVSLCGSKTFSDCKMPPAKNDVGYSHDKAPGVLRNPFDMSNES